MLVLRTCFYHGMAVYWPFNRKMVFRVISRNLHQILQHLSGKKCLLNNLLLPKLDFLKPTHDIVQKTTLRDNSSKFDTFHAGCRHVCISRSGSSSLVICN